VADNVPVLNALLGFLFDKDHLSRMMAGTFS
jgi:hypothetical protein